MKSSVMNSLLRTASLGGLMGTLAFGTLGVAPAAFAQDDEGGFTEEAPPPLKATPKKYGHVNNLKEFADREFPPVAYLAANQLDMEPKFVNGIQTGLNLMFERKYNDARDHFENLEKDFPDTGVASMVDTLVWQALMLENFDFKYDKQFWTSSKEAKADMKVAMAKPGDEAWENLIMAALLGMESIHQMRKTSYMSALQSAFDAMSHITASRKAAPEFTDLNLADGLYNYWRTVITMSSKMLPDFGDKRVEGLEQIARVQDTGVLVAPLASLALAFSWIEEGQYKQALAATTRNRRTYPDNIINNIVHGEIQVYMKRYDTALSTFDQVLKVDPKNRRSRYWKGLSYLKAGKLPEARAELETYLAFDTLEDWQTAYTEYRLGQVSTREKKYKEASDHFQKAVKVDGHKGAKAALDRMKKRKKEGKIDY